MPGRRTVVSGHQSGHWTIVSVRQTVALPQTRGQYMILLLCFFVFVIRDRDCVTLSTDPVTFVRRISQLQCWYCMPSHAAMMLLIVKPSLRSPLIHVCATGTVGCPRHIGSGFASNILPPPLGNLSLMLLTDDIEENVYMLCNELIRTGVADPAGTDLYVVFISNEEKKVPLWHQKAGHSNDGFICWDYHVICIQCFMVLLDVHMEV